MTNGAHGLDGGDVELPIADPPQRLSGMRFPEGWTLPGPPAGMSQAADDAWRQSGFLLSTERTLLAANFHLQIELASTAYTPRARNMTTAAFASLWSRAFSASVDAEALARRGSYQGAMPLVRQAVEFIGAQRSVGSEMDMWKRWTHEAFGRHDATRSIEIGVGHYFGGEAIAGDEYLREIYRFASDCARPNFGPTAMFVANGASHERYPLVFGDESFHLGWAQLIIGWLLRLGSTQLAQALELPGHFPASDDLRQRATDHCTAVAAQLERDGVCRVAEIEDEAGRRRHLLTDFRRRPGDAAQRLLF